MTPAEQFCADHLCAAISIHIADNPEDGPMLVQACMSGMAKAVQKANARSSGYSIAMLCALSLADAKRMPQAHIDNFYRIIADKVGGEGISEIERRFVERGRAIALAEAAQ